MARWKVTLVVKDWAKKVPTAGFAATTLELKNKNPSYHALKRQSRRPLT